MDVAERRALTMLCGELSELRAESGQHPPDKQQLLAQIEAEARARRPILGLLAELMGINREETVRALAGGLPGTGPGHADEERFGCPDGACDRVCTTYPAGPVPRCPLIDDPMTRR